ncbi:hypothetical protein [Clostridium pasteurianum]|uniref:hypothetical protein n=1 Tax=Clostridium pasteurianum TaxID=1501 RepID=UPI001A9A3320|nr:hypothetical protein [Clostridium pasteurianum]
MEKINRFKQLTLNNNVSCFYVKNYIETLIIFDWIDSGIKIKLCVKRMPINI